MDDRLQVARPEAEAQFYDVKPGDSLSKIAKQFYGDANKYNLIFEANRPLIKDADDIYPGQKLRIPAAAASAPEACDKLHMCRGGPAWPPFLRGFLFRTLQRQEPGFRQALAVEGPEHQAGALGRGGTAGEEDPEVPLGNEHLGDRQALAALGLHLAGASIRRTQSPLWVRRVSRMTSCAGRRRSNQTRRREPRWSPKGKSTQ